MVVVRPIEYSSSDPDTTPSNSPQQITQDSTQATENTTQNTDRIESRNASIATNEEQLSISTNYDDRNSDIEYFNSFDRDMNQNNSPRWSPVIVNGPECKEENSPEENQQKTPAYTIHHVNNTNNNLTTNRNNNNNRNNTINHIDNNSNNHINHTNNASSTNNTNNFIPHTVPPQTDNFSIPQHNLALQNIPRTPTATTNTLEIQNNPSRNTAQLLPSGDSNSSTDREQPLTARRFKQQMQDMFNEFVIARFPNFFCEHQNSATEQSVVMQPATRNESDDDMPMRQDSSDEELTTPGRHGITSPSIQATELNQQSYRPFRSIPVNKNINKVPARLTADVNSVAMLSTSLTKIIANMDIKEESAKMEIRNNFDRQYCNTSSRYYIKPNLNLPLQYANGKMAEKPIRLSHMPNIRLFDITSKNTKYTLSLYCLDADRKLGKDKTSFLSDKTLLCIVTSLNIARIEWESFTSVWQKFYPINDKHWIVQIMQHIQPFYIQKKGVQSKKYNFPIDLNTGAMFLVLFERALK